ncbi:type II toxin-antitoxin system VapC family toxin [Desulfonauticus submarinus]
MREIRIYLDNCVFNRPFDEQTSIRIKLETEAKLYIQNKIFENVIELVWSYILEYENEQNPFIERKEAIKEWKKLAAVDIEENEAILNKAKELMRIGLKSKDALHIACAIEGKAEYFLSTDDKILKKGKHVREIKIIDPIEFVKILEAKC